MVSSNKILTVSYGTFSCTLEGFDDSFDTMKAIAEYFRDLAQDDRYFGAEPPTPDAEMLARIAEREIERRVEARFEKGNLVLRPTVEEEAPRGDVAPDLTAGAALVGATAGLAATELAVADRSDDTDELVERAEEHIDTDTQEDAIDLSTLDFEEPEVEDTTPEHDAAHEITTDADDEDDFDLDALVAESDEDDVDELAEVELADADDEDDVSIDDLIAEHSDDADEADLEAEAVSEVDEDEVALTDVEEPVASVTEQVEEVPAATDSVAEKLQRIRAVVASKAQEEPEEPEYIEDEHAMSGPDGDGVDENDAIDVDADIPGFADEIASDDRDHDEEVNIFADTIAAVVNDEIGAVEAEAAEEAEEVAASDTEAELEALRAKVAELEAMASAQKEDAETEVVEDATSVEAELPEDIASDDSSEDFSEDLVEDAVESAEEDAAPIVARVGKAKRSDVEAALASGQIEEYEDEAPVAEATPLPGADDSSLTPEQEAELAQELADLQAEIDEDDDWNFEVSEDEVARDDDKADDAPFVLEDPIEDTVAEDSADDDAVADAEIRKAVKLSSPGRAMLTDTAIEEDDESVDRLIGQAETEMDKPEGNRRRSAIAHLRAAVAATKADRLLGFGKKEVNEEEPYREDLADAVRPRRPKVTETRSERPAPVRPAPLKLVAEQRVDVEEDATVAEPVRPRRVTRSEVVETADEPLASDTGFADFAESQGANTLPELLEAAAAYMSFVEGRDQFSRPQLMTKLHQAEGEKSSREDRLRSFGQLLRDGKIEKKGGGRFAASDNIGFKPDERAAS